MEEETRHSVVSECVRTDSYSTTDHPPSKGPYPCVVGMVNLLRYNIVLISSMIHPSEIRQAEEVLDSIIIALVCHLAEYPRCKTSDNDRSEEDDDGSDALPHSWTRRGEAWLRLTHSSTKCGDCVRTTMRRKRYLC